MSSPVPPLAYQARRGARAGQHPPVLLLLHGYGSNEVDLLGLADALDDRLLVVSARAPLPAPFGRESYSWFPIAVGPDGVVAAPESVVSARQAVVDLLERIAELEGGDAARVLIGGFSQGATVAIAATLARPDLVRGVAAMSGLADDRLLPDPPPPGLVGLPALVQHGVQDEVVPVRRGRAARDLLVRSGLDVTYREYPMSHAISSDSLADLAAWVSDRLREGAR